MNYDTDTLDTRYECDNCHSALSSRLENRTCEKCQKAIAGAKLKKETKLNRRQISNMRRARNYEKDTPKLVKVICPKCNGEYWKDPMRKCSQCSFGYVLVPEAKTEVVCADVKDVDGLVNGFKTALAEFGITLTDHPDFEGSNMLGYILSNRPLTEAELEAIRGDK